MNLERAYLTFSRQNFRFSSAKISDDFFSFSHRPQILNFPPYFASFSTFPPLIGKNSHFPPTFANFPPCFQKIQQLFTYFLCIFPPYFGHDAFMHHPMHVLDSPASESPLFLCLILWLHCIGTFISTLQHKILDLNCYIKDFNELTQVNDLSHGCDNLLEL